jgi:hypothetical protein
LAVLVAKKYSYAVTTPEMMVWLRGFALEVPWLSLIAMWRARSSIKRGAARWDDRLGLVVSYEPISRFWLWSFPASLLLFYATTVAWGLYHSHLHVTPPLPARAYQNNRTQYTDAC